VNSRLQTLALVIARIVVGGYFIGFGLSALWTPKWSLTPFISNPRVFSAFYNAVLISSSTPTLAVAIKILCLAIGGLLILGILVRLSALLGILLMFFLYFPTLAFPYVNIYLIVAVALGMLGAFRAGDDFSISRFFHFSSY
jgi:uncharacterized membrane protein YphA (DoxX/SURF4 family)